MAVMHLTKDNFDEVISKGTVLVDFWAAWCGPCQMIAPVMEELSDEYDGKAVIAKVDIDREVELASRFKIRLIPTIICFKDGEISSKAYGAESKEHMIEMIS
ncbi:MAG: thioredoxin [Oscillospiraceae bacterium]|nr:thioredoxin [Oscillospiraceae bacterium]